MSELKEPEKKDFQRLEVPFYDEKSFSAGFNQCHDLYKAYMTQEIKKKDEEIQDQIHRKYKILSEKIDLENELTKLKQENERILESKIELKNQARVEVESLKSQLKECRGALEYAKKKREFEGRPRTVAHQAMDALDDVANRAKQALNNRKENKG